MIHGIGRARGHSLAELLVVLAMVSFLISSATQLTHRVFHAAARVQRDADLQRVCRRVASRLREDAHAAEHLTADASDPTLLCLSLDDQSTVVYRAHPDRMERAVTRGGEQVHWEEFDFGPSAVVTLHSDRTASLCQLRVFRTLTGTAAEGSPTTSEQERPQCILELSTRVGRRQRLPTTLPRKELP